MWSSSWQINSRQIEGLIKSQKSVVKKHESNVKSLTDKVNLLTDAHNAIKGVYDDNSSTADWMNTYDIGIAWQGVKREDWEECKRSTVEKLRSYCSKIDEILATIQEKLTNAKNELFWEQLALNSGRGYLEQLDRQLSEAKRKESYKGR